MLFRAPMLGSREIPGTCLDAFRPGRVISGGPPRSQGPLWFRMKGSLPAMVGTGYRELGQPDTPQAPA